MSAKSKKRRKAKRANGRTADARAAASKARMLQVAAECLRIRDAVSDGTATAQEREQYENQMKLVGEWSAGLLTDSHMSWEALERPQRDKAV